jgi:hypothetical protein
MMAERSKHVNGERPKIEPLTMKSFCDWTTITDREMCGPWRSSGNHSQMQNWTNWKSFFLK